jgi:hypothetical protein
LRVNRLEFYLFVALASNGDYHYCVSGIDTDCYAYSKAYTDCFTIIGGE